MAAMVLAAALVAGCAPAPSSGGQVTTPGGSLGISAQPSPGDPGGRDVNYIAPAKVEIGNLTPGATGEFELEVHNGKDQAGTFSVAVREPDYTADGYERLPKNYYMWVNISEPKLELGPKESRKVLIAITMPASVSYSKKKAEVWIAVKETGEAAQLSLQIELACRVLITTG